MSVYMSLTPTDRVVLESYKSVLDGLGEYMGQGYELVLHSLEDIDHSAVKVINGHYTGRREGAPITDLALEILAKIKKSGSNHKNLIYYNRNKKGTPIRSATFPITGENDQIIGLLCINFYMDLPLNHFLDSLLKVDGEHDTISETFASSTDDLISSTLEDAKTQVWNNEKITASNKNKEIIAILYHKDIFNLKDAVPKVAERMGISKNTVYMHIRNLNHSPGGQE